jgi:hypothetical protein
VSLFDKVYRWITHGRSPATEYRDVSAAVRAQEARYGSGRKAAKALGIPESTWRGWRSGRPPKPGNPHAERLRVETVKAERRARLKPGRERRLRAGGPIASQIGNVNGVLVVSSERGRTRDVDLADYITPESEQKIVDAYLSGREGAVEDAFREALDDYYPGEWSDVEIEFGGQHYHLD